MTEFAQKIYPEIVAVRLLPFSSSKDMHDLLAFIQNKIVAHLITLPFSCVECEAWQIGD
jgi:hypothetical protein